MGVLFRQLEKHAFELLLIKGWAAARNYPQPSERLAVDIDIAVNPRQFKDCARALVEQNVTGVDLHEGLRHLDTVEWKDLYDNAETVEIDKTIFKILRAEDHLRVLCVHWLNDGGANRERLRDIYYAAAARPADFDWERCLNSVGETRKQWILSTLGLAEKYLKLDLSGTPVAAEAKKIPFWLIKTLENEWNRQVKLKPLFLCISEPEKLWQQIKIRMPPNAIQATIECEGEFDESTRVIYQIKSIARRAQPSLHSICEALRRRAEKGSIVS